MLAAVPVEAAVEVDEDLALVRAARAGHLPAFEQLTRKYERIVLAVVQSMIRKREEAQSTAVEAFFRAYERLSYFSEETKFSTWLMRIVVHESLSRLVLLSVVRDGLLDMLDENDGNGLLLEAADWVTNPNDLYDAQELREILSNALTSVSPTARLVFVLRDIGGFPLRETADILGLSETTVRAHLCRTRLQLRERLATYFKKPMGDADTWISIRASDRGSFSSSDCLSQE
jgi:RNA polymerase sigma-70 factor (ECF subfamily)